MNMKLIVSNRLNEKKLLFRTVKQNQYGYNIKQVNSFFKETKNLYSKYYCNENCNKKNYLSLTYYNHNIYNKSCHSQKIRTILFTPQQGGYQPNIVDHALDRIEDFFAINEKINMIRKYGKKIWLLKIKKLSFLIKGRLMRNRGEKFKKLSFFKLGYSILEVDNFLEYILENIFKKNLFNDINKIRYITFSLKKGKEAYNESQVDMFLDKVVELMVAIKK